MYWNLPNVMIYEKTQYDFPTGHPALFILKYSHFILHITLCVQFSQFHARSSFMYHPPVTKNTIIIQFKVGNPIKAIWRTRALIYTHYVKRNSKIDYCFIKIQDSLYDKNERTLSFEGKDRDGVPKTILPYQMSSQKCPIIMLSLYSSNTCIFLCGPVS